MAPPLGLAGKTVSDNYDALSEETNNFLRNGFETVISQPYTQPPIATSLVGRINSIPVVANDPYSLADDPHFGANNPYSLADDPYSSWANNPYSLADDPLFGADDPLFGAYDPCSLANNPYSLADDPHSGTYDLFLGRRIDRTMYDNINPLIKPTFPDDATPQQKATYHRRIRCEKLRKSKLNKSAQNTRNVAQRTNLESSSSSSSAMISPPPDFRGPEIELDEASAQQRSNRAPTAQRRGPAEMKEMIREKRKLRRENNRYIIEQYENMQNTAGVIYEKAGNIASDTKVAQVVQTHKNRLACDCRYLEKKKSKVNHGINIESSSSSSSLMTSESLGIQGSEEELNKDFLETYPDLASFSIDINLTNKEQAWYNRSIRLQKLRALRKMKAENLPPLLPFTADSYVRKKVNPNTDPKILERKRLNLINNRLIALQVFHGAKVVKNKAGCVVPPEKATKISEAREKRKQYLKNYDIKKKNKKDRNIKILELIKQNQLQVIRTTDEQIPIFSEEALKSLSESMGDVVTQNEVNELYRFEKQRLADCEKKLDKKRLAAEQMSNNQRKKPKP